MVNVDGDILSSHRTPRIGVCVSVVPPGVDKRRENLVAMSLERTRIVSDDYVREVVNGLHVRTMSLVSPEESPRVPHARLRDDQGEEALQRRASIQDLQSVRVTPTHELPGQSSMGS